MKKKDIVYMNLRLIFLYHVFGANKIDFILKIKVVEMF